MGGRESEPWEWRAYRAATGRQVPAAWRRSRRARAGYVLLGAALLGAALASLTVLDLGRLGLFVAAAAMWAFRRAAELPRPLPPPGDPSACPTCGGPVVLREDPEAVAVVSCPACGLARPLLSGAAASWGRAREAATGQRADAADPY